MAYTGAEEERMLAYTPSQKASPPASQSPSQILPTNVPIQHQPPLDNSVAATSERVVDYVKATWADCRPWSEFYSTRHISLPKFAALSDRFATNLHLYRANYQVIAAFWLTCILLGFIPNVLLGLGLLFALQRWCIRRANKNNNTLQHRDQIIAALITLAILWITGLAMFTLASLAFSSVSIAIHASLHEPNHVETEIATV